MLEALRRGSLGHDMADYQRGPRGTPLGGRGNDPAARGPAPKARDRARQDKENTAPAVNGAAPNAAAAITAASRASEGRRPLGEQPAAREGAPPVAQSPLDALAAVVAADSEASAGGARAPALDPSAGASPAFGARDDAAAAPTAAPRRPDGNGFNLYVRENQNKNSKKSYASLTKAWNAMGPKRQWEWNHRAQNEPLPPREAVPVESEHTLTGFELFRRDQADSNQPLGMGSLGEAWATLERVGQMTYELRAGSRKRVTSREFFVACVLDDGLVTTYEEALDSWAGLDESTRRTWADRAKQFMEGVAPEDFVTPTDLPINWKRLAYAYYVKGIKMTDQPARRAQWRELGLRDKYYVYQDALVVERADLPENWKHTGWRAFLSVSTGSQEEIGARWKGLRPREQLRWFQDSDRIRETHAKPEKAVRVAYEACSDPADPSWGELKRGEQTAFGMAFAKKKRERDADNSCDDCGGSSDEDVVDLTATPRGFDVDKIDDAWAKANVKFFQRSFGFDTVSEMQAWLWCLWPGMDLRLLQGKTSRRFTGEPARRPRRLSDLQEFMLYQMRKRTGFPLYHLALLFGLGSDAHASYVVNTWLAEEAPLAEALLRIMPPKDWVRAHMPEAYLNAGLEKVFLGFDAFDVPLERNRRDLDVLTASMSSKIHCAAARFLPPSTPNGHIVHPPPPRLGAVSDGAMFGVMPVTRKIPRGVAILADRAYYSIRAKLPFCNPVVFPPFRNQKKHAPKMTQLAGRAVAGCRWTQEGVNARFLHYGILRECIDSAVQPRLALWNIVIALDIQRSYRRILEPASPPPPPVLVRAPPPAVGTSFRSAATLRTASTLLDVAAAAATPRARVEAHGLIATADLLVALPRMAANDALDEVAFRRRRWAANLEAWLRNGTRAPTVPVVRAEAITPMDEGDDVRTAPRSRMPAARPPAVQTASRIGALDDDSDDDADALDLTLPLAMARRCLESLTADEEAEARAATWAARRELVATVYPYEVFGEHAERIRGVDLAGYLVDELINPYMKLLQDRDTALRARDSSHRGAFFQTTFFMNRLMGGEAHRSYQSGACDRWTRRIPANTRRIYVPINQNLHWSLVVVDFDNGEIVYLDSGQGDTRARGRKYMDVMKCWVRDSYSGEGAPTAPAEWRLVQSGPTVPRQENGYDCGVFTCYYAHFHSLGASLAFAQRDCPHLRMRLMWDIKRGKVDF